MNEIWAKISQAEKFIVYGAVAVLVGWIVGQFIATVNLCGGLSIAGYSCPSISYFSAGNSGLFAILGLVGAVATVVVLYLKVTNASITWPMPVAQVLLGVAGATLVCGVLVVLMQVTLRPGRRADHHVDRGRRSSWAAAPVMAWFAYRVASPARPRNLSFAKRRSPKGGRRLLIRGARRMAGADLRPRLLTRLSRLRAALLGLNDPEAV